MADELALRDRNRVTALLIQNESGELIMAGATDATGRLKVDAVITGGSSSNTEYTEGDIDAAISGIAIMWEDAADTMRAVSASKPLPIEIKNTTIAVTQSGVWDITDITGTISLPTGASTAANQTTIIGHVDGIETLLGTIDVDTSTLAGAVSGSEVQVDIVGALPTGSNTIGKVGHDITGINHGSKTIVTAGTPEVLAGSTACKRVTIQAYDSNTGDVAIGGSSVDVGASGSGIVLRNGDAFELDIDNLADVYIDVAVDGEGVRYTYFT